MLDIVNELKQKDMCEECNGFSGRSYCPVCSDEVYITPLDELKWDPRFISNLVNGEIVEVTIWRDGKTEEEVVSIDDLSAELRDRLIYENEEE